MTGDTSTLRPHGGYRRLRSFQVTEIVYDGTVGFCDRFIDKRSRTHDQMVQAARSGRQNIAEGSRASATSSQTELRLVGVARASLEELLLDFEDFLRQRKLRQWGKDDAEARRVRAVGAKTDRTDQSDQTDRMSESKAYSEWLDHRDGAVVANALICLIHQANHLLDQQLRALERQFIEGGGYSERLAAARLEKRRSRRLPVLTEQSDPSNRSDKTKTQLFAPSCQACGMPMTLRTARTGSRAGSQFWGLFQLPGVQVHFAGLKLSVPHHRSGKSSSFRLSDFRAFSPKTCRSLSSLCRGLFDFADGVGELGVRAAVSPWRR